ncbi:DUF1232 domain-containing protein [Plantactinospora sp. DSM 117369]
MAKTMKRTSAFIALGRGLTAGLRGGPGLGKRLVALPRMITATARGQYDGGVRLAMMAAATVFIASPVDLMPELFLAVFGLADDALMIAWLAGTVLAETERFLAWEARQRAVKPGTIVRTDHR